MNYLRLGVSPKGQVLLFPIYRGQKNINQLNNFDDFV